MPARMILLLILLPLLASASSGYGEERLENCRFPQGTVVEDLPAALARHDTWLKANYDGLLAAHIRGRAQPEGRISSFCNLDLDGRDLKGGRLAFADLRGALLTRSDLSGAILERSDLTGASLNYAQLGGAQLLEAKLRGADLTGADLSKSNLSGADLSGANLQGANLEGAILYRTLLTDTKLEDANLKAAQFEPRGRPSPEWLAALRGVSQVWFCENEESAMVRLRAAFREAGLRELEREATFAVEHHRTAYALASWDPDLGNSCGRLQQNRWAAVEGAFRLVYFEWTSGYGLAYGRPLLILLGLIGLFALAYLPALILEAGRGGVYRVWPADRIEQIEGKPTVAGSAIVERLSARGLRALGLSLYFSLISAFHLGWRDLNVGTWLARLQPRDYALRGQGWVRVVSGLQSLISVYLIALWALTYFGRPFE